MMILIFIAGMFTGTLLTSLCVASKSNEEMEIHHEDYNDKNKDCKAESEL